MSSRTLSRLAACVVGVVVATLVFSGAYSLWTGASILDLGSDRAAVLRLGMLDAERQRMAAMTVGPYVVDPDPEVAIRMKGKRFEDIVLGVGATTDGKGQRIRLGPEPHPDATRILLLGDSVAWSWGLEDHETWHHQLEEALAGAMAEGSPRPAVFSLACPGWNYRNAFRALLNDLAHYDPDIVLFIPVENDLDDSFVINEVGHREYGPDPDLGGVRPSFGAEHYWRTMMAVKERFSTDLVRRILGGGREVVEYALLTDLTPTSRALWTEMTDRLSDLQSRLTHHGVRFASVLRVASHNQLLHEHKVGEAVPDHPLVPLFDSFDEADKIPGDGHPDAAYVEAAARCVAEWLVDRGWVPGARAEALPAIDPDYASRRRTLRPPQELRAWAAAQKDEWSRFMEHGVRLSDGSGCHQIYGGVAADGAVGRHFAAGLANPGARTVELKIERLPVDAGVYPLTLRVRFDGVPGETRSVPPPDEAAELSLSFPVPPTVQSASLVDVQLDSSNWVVQVHEGKSRVIAYRLREILLAP